jgi:hypothetical protein
MQALPTQSRRGHETSASSTPPAHSPFTRAAFQPPLCRPAVHAGDLHNERASHYAAKYERGEVAALLLRAERAAEARLAAAELRAHAAAVEGEPSGGYSERDRRATDEGTGEGRGDGSLSSRQQRASEGDGDAGKSARGESGYGESTADAQRAQAVQGMCGACAGRQHAAPQQCREYALLALGLHVAAATVLLRSVAWKPHT